MKTFTAVAAVVVASTLFTSNANAIVLGHKINAQYPVATSGNKKVQANSQKVNFQNQLAAQQNAMQQTSKSNTVAVTELGAK